MAIPLGRRLLDISSSLPGGHYESGKLANRRNAGRCPLFGLAPDGVYLAKLVTQPAGELLPHRFTLTWRRRSLAGRFTFCCTFPDLSVGGRYPPSFPMEPGLSSRWPQGQPATTQSTFREGSVIMTHDTAGGSLNQSRSNLGEAIDQRERSSTGAISCGLIRPCPYADPGSA